MSQAPINYKLITQALDFYQTMGYKYVDVPWLVSPEANAATAPPGIKPFDTWDGQLVGSGEQSFVQMMLDGTLPKGKYVCVTPCFRDDQLDELHRRYFLKVELIDTREDANYMNLMFDADRFFHTLAMQGGLVTMSAPVAQDQWDLIDTKTRIELGSYGKRAFNGFTWHYGTGLAEPRYSQVLQKRNEA